MAEDNFHHLQEDLDNGNVIEKDIIFSKHERPASSHDTPAAGPIEPVKSNVDHKPGADATEHVKCYVDNEQAVTNEPIDSAKSKVDNEPAVTNEFTESAKTHDSEPPLSDKAFETANRIDKKGKGPKKGKKSKKASTPLGDVIASSSEPIAQVFPQPIEQVLPQPIAQVLPQLVSTSHTQAKTEEQKKPRNKRNKKKNFTIFSADPRSPLLKDCMILPSIVGQPAEFKGESSKVADSIQDTRVKLVNKLKLMKKQKSGKSKVDINLAFSKEHSVDGASTSFNAEQTEIKIVKNKKINGKNNNKIAMLQNEPGNIKSTHNMKKEGRKDDKALQYILDSNKPDDNEPNTNNDGDWSTDFCTEKEEDGCKNGDFTFEKVDETTYSMKDRPVRPKIKTFELDDAEILLTFKKKSDSDN